MGRRGGAGPGAVGAGIAGGAGGDGSSFVDASPTSTSSAASSRRGDGQVTIPFDPTTDACPTTVVAAFTGELTATAQNDSPRLG